MTSKIPDAAASRSVDRPDPRRASQTPTTVATATRTTATSVSAGAAATRPRRQCARLLRRARRACPLPPRERACVRGDRANRLLTSLFHRAARARFGTAHAKSDLPQPHVVRATASALCGPSRLHFTPSGAASSRAVSAGPEAVFAQPTSEPAWPPGDLPCRPPPGLPRGRHDRQWPRRHGGNRRKHRRRRSRSTSGQLR